MVNHLVANRQLCEIYPLKTRPCGEMDSIRLQARLMNDLQAFIDAEHGGAGKGWLRIVRSEAEARRVIEDGKLAVLLGIETSEPFGCRQVLGVPLCSKADIDRGLDEMHALGVRSMFVCHKYDNALCGVRFDSGTQGVFVNAGNFLSTGRFWQARTCTGELSDNTVTPDGVLPDPIAPLVPPLPLYPPAPHCNIRGLTALGEHMVRGMMARGMIVELDHMSAKAATRTLEILEAADYPGVVSSHSWTDPKLFPGSTPSAAWSPSTGTAPRPSPRSGGAASRCATSTASRATASASTPTASAGSPARAAAARRSSTRSPPPTGRSASSATPWRSAPGT
ncbi:hypothetical protein ACFQV2_17120 [Actinokineospora soli]|uniref:Membrane dipeptidase (Peptidase family M19) n=1 Tax=Actinokineospora soli TaxID=1048753 RepID=A0ABW2TNK7_9PSEU